MWNPSSSKLLHKSFCYLHSRTQLQRSRSDLTSSPVHDAIRKSRPTRSCGMTSKFISETVDTPGAHNAWSVALNASLHTIERELRIFSQFHVPRRCVPPVRSIRVAGVAIEPWPRRPGSSRRPRLVQTQMGRRGRHLSHLQHHP